MALDNRDGEEFILCESDDLGFEFDWNATCGCGVHYCFIKQKARNMLSEGCDRLYNLHRRKQLIHGSTCTRET